MGLKSNNPIEKRESFFFEILLFLNLTEHDTLYQIFKPRIPLLLVKTYVILLKSQTDDVILIIVWKGNN